MIQPNTTYIQCSQEFYRNDVMEFEIYVTLNHVLQTKIFDVTNQCQDSIYPRGGLKRPKRVLICVSCEQHFPVAVIPDFATRIRYQLQLTNRMKMMGQQSKF